MWPILPGREKEKEREGSRQREVKEKECLSMYPIRNEADVNSEMLVALTCVCVLLFSLQILHSYLHCFLSASV